MVRKKTISCRTHVVDLDTVDQGRRVLDETRERTAARLEQAFQAAGGDLKGDRKAGEVKTFLSSVVRNIDSYGTRVRVKHSELETSLETDWVRLCGATIPQLGVGRRVRNLIFEYVASLLPGEDPEGREKLARAAGVDLIRRVTPKNVSALKRQGMVGSFVARLFCDCKALTCDPAAASVDGYFAQAEAMAVTLQRSPYLTGRDRRFLSKCPQGEKGPLLHLVDQQKTSVLDSVRKINRGSTGLERVLRHLIKDDFIKDDFDGGAVGDLDVWWGEVKRKFTPVAYVRSRLDEFSEALRKRIDGHRGRHFRKPSETAETASGLIGRLIEKFNAEVEEAGIALEWKPDGEIDLAEMLREHAEMLGSPGVVQAFNRLISEDVLLQVCARYKACHFQMRHEELNAEILEGLAIWDEICRGHDLSPEQRDRLDSLKADLTGYLEQQAGYQVPPELAATADIFAFARGVLGLLRGKVEYEYYREWLGSVRDVCNRPSMDAAYPPAYSSSMVDPGGPTGSGRRSSEPTEDWIPLLVTPQAAGVDLMDLDDPGDDVPPEAALDPEKQVGSIETARRQRAWKGWPWNWRKQAR